MRTVSFQQLLEGVFAHAGTALEDVGDDDKLAVIAALADRYKFAAEYYRWPELTLVEERTPDGRKIAFDQANETEIAVVLGITEEDPRAEEHPQPLSWTLRGDGVWIAPGAEIDGTVWVEFLPPPAEFTATLYSATTAYAAGRRVYFEDLGDVYRAIEATAAGETPVTHPAKWDLVEFPAFLELAVKAGAYADWLTGDERPNASRLWDAKFIELLDEQVWQLTKLQGQTGRPRFNPANR